jgi:hypothetical protein
MLKQGGGFKINGTYISTTPTETILTSRGEKDGVYTTRRSIYLVFDMKQLYIHGGKAYLVTENEY